MTAKAPRAPIEALGPRGRAEMVHNILLQLQHKRMLLDIEMLANGKTEADILPSDEARGYGDECSAIDERIAQVEERYAHLMPVVEGITRRTERDQEDEEARLDAMSPEERNAERQRR